MILVTGATGTVGRELVRLLSLRGEAVRALVRSPAKAFAPKELGVEIALGDLAEPATLVQALKGIGKVFLLTPSSPQQVELENNLIETARLTDVNYIVKLSTLGAKEDSLIAICRWHGQAEKLVQRSGLPYSFLRPQNFMQNLLAFAPGIRQQGTILAPLREGRVSLVDARDVAAVAAAVLMQEGHEGEIYRITGPERLSFRDIADRLSEALSRKIAYIDVPEEAARQALLNEGMPPWLVEDQMAIYRFFSVRQNPLITDTVAQLAQKPPHTFGRFVSDHIHAFR